MRSRPALAISSILAIAFTACATPAFAALWLAVNPSAEPAPFHPVLDLPADSAPASQPDDSKAAPKSPELGPDGIPKETVEADVSTHTIDVTTGYSGTEVVVFGTVDHSRQPSPEAGYYDVVIVIQGRPVALVARSKSNVAGLWINTGSMLFDAVPSFYAISSTRPLEEVAEPDVLRAHGLGFDHVRMRPRQGRVPNFTTEDLTAYRHAIVRIKQRDHLYPRDDFGVAFIGRSLFRTSIRLPANVPVGALQAHVHLFREGQLLSSFSSPVKLERRGVEAYIFDFAHSYPALYGMVTVLLAAATGMAGAMLFRRM